MLTKDGSIHPGDFERSIRLDNRDHALVIQNDALIAQTKLREEPIQGIVRVG